MALVGFTRHRLEQGGAEPKGAVAIPDDAIEKVCHLVDKTFDKEDLRLAHATLTNVWPHFPIA